MSKRDAALAWAARGFRVFPIKANAKLPPLVEPFFDAASADPATITKWWSDIYGNELDHNIGVSTTGLVVVDLDCKPGKDGLSNYQKLGGGFDTLIVQTPSGGYHLYFNSDVELANTQGDKGGLAPAIDTRGRHGYVLAPGSTIDGKAYSVWRDQAVGRLNGPIGARLYQIETERASRRVTAAADVDPASAAAFATDYLVNRAPVAVEGEGGDTTTYAVCCAVRDYGVDPGVALDLLLELWNDRCEPPWEPGELAQKIENAFRYGQNQGAVRHPLHQFGGAVTIPPIEYAAEPDVLKIEQSWGNLLPQTALGPRPWIYKRFLIRRDVTTMIASGGVGKTQAAIFAAVVLARGVDFLSFENAIGEPRKSLIYDAEETMQELSMRVHAQCLLLNIDPASVAPYIKLVSGREGPAQDLKIAVGGKGNRPVIFHEQTCKALIAACSADDVAMLVLNPLIAVHEADENDNNAMRAVLRVCEMIAAEANIGVLVAHHTPKGDDTSGRGASSVRDAARVSITLRGPTDEDRVNYGLQPNEVVSYLRVDDAKANKSLISTKATWLRREGVRLLSGEIVGALAPADLHSRADEIRQKMATVIATGMRAATTGSISIEAAAELLRHGWSLLDTDDKRTIKARIERALREPCLLDDGTTVLIKVTETGRKVCLE